MSKRLFIMGQCTLHWGRMEFGNIGNYYIVKPLFKELRRVFPQVTFVTTMQFSDEFCEAFEIKTVPMEIYYDFNRKDNLEIAKKEYEAVCRGIEIESQYIEEIKQSDLVIDFSGDIWGDNADFLGKDRFITGLYKDLIAQAMKPTVMIAGSPGPFNNQKDIAFIKKVFSGFDFITNREHISTLLLQRQGFDLSKEKDFACPSFLFEPIKKDKEQYFTGDLPKVGFMLCGWNFKEAPYDRWPRNDIEYNYFVLMIENLIQKYHIEIYLLSHSNGFDTPPKPFRLKQGRDFLIIQQLKKILDSKGYASHVKILDKVYTPEVTKGIIAQFDMLISGRMHGAVAGLSQNIPTVIIDYGHEPKAHKLHGFAELAGIEQYIANPNELSDLIKKTEQCYEKKEEIRSMLEKHIPNIKQNARKQFDCLKHYME